MEVTFIKVNMMYGKGKDALKPLLFSIIKGLTPKDIKINFIDERIEDIPQKIDSDIIALSVENFSAKRAYEIAKKYKTAKNKIVMGGIHPTTLPNEALEHADTVLIGDSEDTWSKYLEDVKKGAEKKIYISENKNELSKIDYNSDCYKGKKYLKLGMVQTSRGCKFNCDFCSIKNLYKNGVRRKDVDKIIEEIKEIKEKLIFFIDDNIFYNEETAKELFEKLKPLNKKWACQISIDIAFNDELLTKMKEAGCFLILIGFESLNKNNLKQMNKTANLQIAKYEEAINNIYKHNLMIYAMFVLGYDYDTKESIEQTYEFALKHNFAVSNFNPLMVLPGTSLYKRIEEENRLIYKKWWLEDNYKYGDTMYIPKNMKPEELAEGCKNVRYKFNTYTNIFKRLVRNKVNHASLFNIITFLMLNIISRKEIHRKQGKTLGGKKK